VIYDYWIIRFVPDTARGEFSNIGIVAGADERDWHVAFDTRFTRNHGDYRPDLGELGAWIRWFQRSVLEPEVDSAAERSTSRGWIDHLRTRMVSNVQFSPGLEIDADSALAAVQTLFPRLVEREATRRRSSLNRQRLRAEVRTTLVDELDFTQGLDLFSTPRAAAGRQRTTFDIARIEHADVSDGLALTNVWAFNVATLDSLERDIQSWNYFVTRVRQEGASIEVGVERAVDNDVRIEAIIDPPGRESSRLAELEDILDAAGEAWSLAGVRVLTLDDFRQNARERNQSAIRL
jgi:hypothetical protein